MMSLGNHALLAQPTDQSVIFQQYNFTNRQVALLLIFLTVPSQQSYSRRVATGHSASTAFLSLARFWRTAGLKITADQRTKSGLIAYLTGQTLVLPVILTGHLWIRTFYFPYSCRLMLYNAAMISIFFAFFAALLLQKDSASIEQGRVRSLLSMRGMLLGYSFEPRPNSLSLETEGSVMVIRHIN